MRKDAFLKTGKPAHRGDPLFFTSLTTRSRSYWRATLQSRLLMPEIPQLLRPMKLQSYAFAEFGKKGPLFLIPGKPAVTIHTESIVLRDHLLGTHFAPALIQKTEMIF